MKNIYLAVAVLVAMVLVLFFYRHTPFLEGVHNSLLPNSALTPGVTNPTVTQATIQKTICVSGWTATIRPPSTYTSTLKIKQIAQYHFTDTKPADYEEDHDVSLELGGSPTDPKNLWPEAYPAAHQKDAVENQLHKAVCAGTMSLSQAQKIISTDWTSYKSNTVGAADSYDPDDEQ